MRMPVSSEDKLRTQMYRMLANFLSNPPDKITLQAASDLQAEQGEIGDAISNFAKIAARTVTETAETEYHDLFIGVTRGELLPFGSYYQTGFLNEKPLANLRADMSRLGIERSLNSQDPEDHIASLFEMMAGLIDGTFGESLSLAEQKHFFNKHIDSWASHFFSDLEGAKKSVLYAPIGTIGRLFMDIERDAFKMC